MAGPTKQPRQPFMPRFTAGVVCLLPVVFALLAAGCSVARAPEPKLLAIVDAGSSGSRLTLYRAEPTGSLPRIEQLMSSNDAPRPLSWFDGVNAPAEQAGPQGVAPLLDKLRGYLDEQRLPTASVQVSVLATAGMRLLEERQARPIYNSVAETIAAAGYRLGRTETISGQMEAVYRWVDVNHLLGNLDPGRQTRGIVEVGGASAQVAFHAANPTAPGVFTLRLNGDVYPVFGVSYLGLGQNEARRAMLENPSSGGTRGSVCYPNSVDSALQFDTGFVGRTVQAASSVFSAVCQSVYASVIARFGGAMSGSPSVREVAASPDFQSTHFVGVASV